MAIQGTPRAGKPRGNRKWWHGWYVGDDGTRIKAVKQALAGRVKPVYLEIGVCRGYAPAIHR